MKRLVLLVLVLAAVFGFSDRQTEKLNPYPGCDSVPELNKKIVDFVKTKLNKKVGRGECWDLAAEALNTHKAKWDGDYKFGREVNYRKECVFPGDILQFEGVEIQYREGNRTFTETLEHHTSILYVTKSNQEFIVAEQNTSDLGKKVGTHPLQLQNIKKGKFKIFRPQP